MDKISDILDSIKDRLTNPLFVSFVVSWILCNWEITVVLLWYDERLWKGYENAFEYIYATRGWWKSLIFPGLLAIGYITLNPWLKNTIKLVNLFFDNWGGKHLEKMSGDVRVKFSEFSDKFNELKERENSLATIQNEQKQTKNKIIELEELLNQTQKDLFAKQQLLAEQKKNQSTLMELHQIEKDNLENKFQAEKEEIHKQLLTFTDISIIIGKWEIRPIDKNSPPKKTTISMKQTTYELDSQILFYRNRGFFRTNEGRIFFVTKSTGNHESYFYDLTINPDGSMRGSENDRKVIFLKLPTEGSTSGI